MNWAFDRGSDQERGKILERQLWLRLLEAPKWGESDREVVTNPVSVGTAKYKSTSFKLGKFYGGAGNSSADTIFILPGLDHPRRKDSTLGAAFMSPVATRSNYLLPAVDTAVRQYEQVTASA